MDLEKIARDLLGIRDHYLPFITALGDKDLLMWANEIGDTDVDREVAVVLKIMAEKELSRRA